MVATDVFTSRDLTLRRARQSPRRTGVAAFLIAVAAAAALGETAAAQGPHFPAPPAQTTTH